MRFSFASPKRLTIMGLLLAVTVILDISPLGAIPLGAISATIVHIPTIIAGVILGPVEGLILGFSMGVVGFIHAVTRPVTLLDPLFMNPLVSVLPRMFIGVVSYYVFSLLKKLIRKSPANITIGTFVAGIAGSLTNTGLVFLMLYILYAQEVAKRFGIAFKVLVISIFTSNAIAEALVSAFLTLTIAMAYFKFAKTENNK